MLDYSIHVRHKFVIQLASVSTDFPYVIIVYAREYTIRKISSSGELKLQGVYVTRVPNPSSVRQRKLR